MPGWAVTTLRPHHLPLPQDGRGRDRWQTIFLARPEPAFRLLLFCQPRAKRLCIVPTHPADRVSRALRKTGAFPRFASPLPAISPQRNHAYSGIIAARLHEGLKVLHPRVPNGEEHLRARHRHELHPERVFPRLANFRLPVRLNSGLLNGLRFSFGPWDARSGWSFLE